MTHREKVEGAPEQEAELIVGSSDVQLRHYLHRGMKERWLSTLIRGLNWLELQPPSQTLARQALRRIGFPASH
jgi:hypothetical protein